MGLLIAALSQIAFHASAQDFSEGSEAKSSNPYAEVPATFEATVVDGLCELTGERADECGGGSRQLGLLHSADVMVLPNKNAKAALSGAAGDLAYYCAKTVQVDGLLIDDEDLEAQNFDLARRVKTDGGEWAAANLFTMVWGANNPDAAGRGPCFRHNPRVNAAIAEEGYLGLGLEADAAFIKEYFECESR